MNTDTQTPQGEAPVPSEPETSSPSRKRPSSSALDPVQPPLKRSAPAAPAPCSSISSSASAPLGRHKVRCSQCRRRVRSLAAQLPCRCGHVFCALHRLSTEHKCSFDFQAEQRAALARDNPQVQAPKLVPL